MTKTNYIYFIAPVHNHNMVKIGFSKNPQARLKQLQTASAEKLEIIHIIKCYRFAPRYVERKLHYMLKYSHRCGEWYEMYPEKLDWLRSYHSDIQLYGLSE